MQVRIPSLVRQQLVKSRMELLTLRKDLLRSVQALLSRQHHRVELLGQRILDASPEKLLKRGYSITLKDGKAVTDATLLKSGDRLVTLFSKGKACSVVQPEDAEVK